MRSRTSTRRTQHEAGHRGFEVQIDDNARGDGKGALYGIWLEPDGLYKNRTGAIYKIQAGDRIWHENRNEPAVQNYRARQAQITVTA